MSGPAEEHRTVAGRFTELVRGAAPDGWDRPSPCPGWAARDVVRHLVEVSDADPQTRLLAFIGRGS
ncbi:maleylpyruvate isomerase N-terminal domain-containing protein [Dactylosporangium roseum]|uniref:Maleylpyruvate isomerase N-terminal domain-containing protein n=1 Tax=Dactylosporangium roseum TaxID=47989 RepID=A0ABY5Z1R3_9ACTN|nr:maleylpyruvate isomerase N-terminal domain-containing protein [Dactylosporangium roseum]UWZ34995.1 maleylpyruvate isomerase N-terminal domain-containing protein [Dactylosporangium roseum]